LNIAIHAQVIAKNPKQWQTLPTASPAPAGERAEFSAIQHLARRLLNNDQTVSRRFTMSVTSFSSIAKAPSKLDLAILASVAAMSLFVLTQQLLPDTLLANSSSSSTAQLV
jgi:hypothetical protein